MLGWSAKKKGNAAQSGNLMLPGGTDLGNNFTGPFSSCGVAKFMINECEVPHLSMTKLIKLAYIAHGWLLGLTDGKQLLVNEEVEVWQYGPVFSSLYYTLRDEESIATSAALAEEEDIEEGAETNLIKHICEHYGKFSAVVLINKTHRVGSPWHVALHTGNQIISNDLITSFYKKGLKV